MNAFAKLRAARLALATGIVVRALGWGAVAALTVVVGATLVDIAVPLSVDVRGRVIAVAAAAGIATTLALAWRDRSVLSAKRVALWVEEHFPSLEYSLVTAVEAGDERFVAGVSADSWVAVAWRRAVASLRAPLSALVAAVIVVLLLPTGAVARVRAPRAGDSLDRGRSSRGAVESVAAARGGPRSSRVQRTAADDHRRTGRRPHVRRQPVDPARPR